LGFLFLVGRRWLCEGFDPVVSFATLGEFGVICYLVGVGVERVAVKGSVEEIGGGSCSDDDILVGAGTVVVCGFVFIFWL